MKNIFNLMDTEDKLRFYKEGITEQLKNENPLEWLQRVNGIKARVEEGIVRNLLQN